LKIIFRVPLSLAPGFSRVFAQAHVASRFNGFCEPNDTPSGAKPLKRFTRLRLLSPG